MSKFAENAEKAAKFCENSVQNPLTDAIMMNYSSIIHPSSMHSLMHKFTHPFFHHPSINSPIYPFICSSRYSPSIHHSIYAYSHSSIACHPFILPPYIDSFIPSIHSFYPSIHSSTPIYPFPSPPLRSIHPFIPSSFASFTHSSIHPFVHPSIHPFMHF